MEAPRGGGDLAVNADHMGFGEPGIGERAALQKSVSHKEQQPEEGRGSGKAPHFLSILFSFFKADGLEGVYLLWRKSQWRPRW